jgi:neutral ceramidase
VLIIAPTELTTMAGRRLRAHIRAELVASNVLSEAEGTVVIAGLANGYADYTTTFEEYQQQRYEGGSTVFGPHQLNAYIQEFSKIARDMGANTTPTTSAPPVDFSDKLSKNKTLTVDHLPSGAKHFGDVLLDVHPTATAGGVAIAKFAGANPVNNLQPEGTFAEVQRCAGTESPCTSWVTVAVDSDWDTRIRIAKTKVDVVYKARTWQIEWHLPSTTTSGVYRLVHHGTSYAKPLLGSGKLTPYTGVSSPFTVA